MSPPYALAHARAYAAHGWPVLTLAPGEKRPARAGHGFKDATTDLDTIRARFEAEPGAGVGIHPGPAGLLVLDVDCKNGAPGPESLEALQAAHGTLPATLTQRTPSGGFHLLFKLDGPGNFGNRSPAPGIDVRCAGGYIAAEPTQLAAGSYSFEDWDILAGELPEVAPAPAWLLHLLRTPEPRKADAVARTADQAPDERYADLTRHILAGDVLHNSLRDMAAAMVAARMQSGAVVNHLRGLMDASSAPRDERWKARRDQIPELVNTAAAKFAPVAADFPELLAASKASEAPRYHLLTPDELHSLPPLAWCVRGVLPAAGLAALFGPSASGKSFLGFDLAAAIGGGWRWFGHRVTPAPVVYAALEGEAGFKLRAQAWVQHHGRKLPEGLRLMLQPFRLTEPQDVADLAAVVPAGAVLFLDTLNRAAPTADENSSRDMGTILEASKLMQAATGGLVVLIHHTGKDAGRGLRGHSSLFAAMDAAVEVSREGDRREWKVSKSKDGQDGASHPFALRVVDLGADEHGDPITSCAVTPGESNAPRAPRLTPALSLALQTLVEAGEQSGELNAAGVLRGVHVDAWRRVFYSASTADGQHAKKLAFQRGRAALCEAELATVEADYYLPTDPALHVRIAETRRQALAAHTGSQPAHEPS